MAKETGETNLTAISPTPQTGAEFLERVDAMQKAGIDMCDIIIRTGYFKKGGDYGQANIDFFNAKLAAQKADGSWQKARDKEEAARVAYREEVNKRYEILANKRVCITGKLTYPRHMIEDWLSTIGATAVSGVSKTTDVLIVGDKPGSKLDKAKELDIKILQETEAIELLDEFMDDGLPEGWSKPIIDKLISGLTDTNTDGYFKITDHKTTRIVRLSSKEEVNEWLSDQVDESIMVYEEMAALKVIWVEADTVNNVTAWYYDEECDDITDFEVQTFNTEHELRAFLNEVNSGWGGHLSTIKVLYKTGDKTKIIVGTELEKAKYPHWDYDYERVFNNLEAYPGLLQLFSPDIKKQIENTPDTARKELDEIIRKGLWPTKAGF